MVVEQIIDYIGTGGLSSISLIEAATLSLIGVILLILGIIFLLAWLAVGIGGFILWIWMLVDCVQRKFPNRNEKWIWFAVLIASIFGAGLLLHVFAAIAYNFAIRKREKIPLKREKKAKK